MYNLLALVVALYSFEFVSTTSYLVSEIYIDNRFGKGAVLVTGLLLSILVVYLYFYNTFLRGV